MFTVHLTFSFLWASENSGVPCLKCVLQTGTQASLLGPWNHCIPSSQTWMGDKMKFKTSCQSLQILPEFSYITSSSSPLSKPIFNLVSVFFLTCNVVMHLSAGYWTHTKWQALCWELHIHCLYSSNPSRLVVFLPLDEEKEAFLYVSGPNPSSASS